MKCYDDSEMRHEVMDALVMCAEEAERCGIVPDLRSGNGEGQVMGSDDLPAFHTCHPKSWRRRCVMFRK